MDKLLVYTVSVTKSKSLYAALNDKTEWRMLTTTVKPRYNAGRWRKNLTLRAKTSL